MECVSQSPVDPRFVQDPYPFYDEARAKGMVVFWDEYDLPAVFSYAGVNALLRDPRLGRADPDAGPRPEHLSDFYAIDDNSMLELEAPRHTRLRKLVLKAFTQRRIANLAPEIDLLCHGLIDGFPQGQFDILETYAQKVPVIVIARLLGLPDTMADQLLTWSSAMVAMYQARRDRTIEDSANAAARDFAAWLRDYIDARRSAPRDDLISELIAAGEGGTHLSTDEMIATCVLLLNAGHEATVHTLGNSLRALLQHGWRPEDVASDRIAATVEELTRFDPPLHMFTRYVYEDVDVGRSKLPAGSQVALMLGAACHDPKRWDDPHVLNLRRTEQPHVAFGAGRHFCLGAALARLELQVALGVLLQRCPKLTLADTPRYANVYHFHGLERLDVTHP